MGGRYGKYGDIKRLQVLRRGRRERTRLERSGPAGLHHRKKTRPHRERNAPHPFRRHI